MSDKIIKTTLGELRTELQGLLAMPDDTQVTFGSGDLRFHRLKNRGPLEGPAVINFEFSTLYTVTHQL
jgi:hypothetical protein